MQLRAADFDDYPELQELARKYGMVKNPKNDQLSHDFVCKVGHSYVCQQISQILKIWVKFAQQKKRLVPLGANDWGNDWMDQFKIPLIWWLEDFFIKKGK